MTSFISEPRNPLADCEPKIHLNASTTFDFPQPFGPTIAVRPGSKVNSVRSANDLKPRSSSFLRYTNYRLRRRARAVRGTPGTFIILGPASAGRTARWRGSFSASLFQYGPHRARGRGKPSARPLGPEYGTKTEIDRSLQGLSRGIDHQEHRRPSAASPLRRPR